MNACFSHHLLALVAGCDRVELFRSRILSHSEIAMLSATSNSSVNRTLSESNTGASVATSSTTPLDSPSDSEQLLNSESDDASSDAGDREDSEDREARNEAIRIRARLIFDKYVRHSTADQFEVGLTPNVKEVMKERLGQAPVDLFLTAQVCYPLLTPTKANLP
jgi:hypothetical protein